jgi:hypothetical protein
MRYAVALPATYSTGCNSLNVIMATALELLEAPCYIAASLFNASFELDNST